MPNYYNPNKSKVVWDESLTLEERAVEATRRKKKRWKQKGIHGNKKINEWKGENRLASHLTIDECLEYILLMSWSYIKDPAADWFYKLVAYKINVRNKTYLTLDTQSVRKFLSDCWRYGILEWDDVYQELLLILHKQILSRGFYQDGRIIVKKPFLFKIVALNFADWLGTAKLPRQLNEKKTLFIQQIRDEEQQGKNFYVNDLPGFTLLDYLNMYPQIPILEKYLLYLYKGRDYTLKEITEMTYLYQGNPNTLDKQIQSTVATFRSI